jgi:uncharacterized protein
MNITLLFIFFFAIAAIYASAGFGGGSSYIAVLVLASVEISELRTVALLCNLVVTAASCFWFWRDGEWSSDFFKRILPLCVASVPMAFLGGLLAIKTAVFMALLGFSLVISAILMFSQDFLIKNSLKKNASQAQNNVLSNTFLGAAIGFLSGIVGIGGGIFLSPFLYLNRWASAKTIAAATAFFIFINSLAGLSGQWAKQGHLSLTFALPLLVAVFFGGQVGIRLSLLWFTPRLLRNVTAVLILYAGINILMKL